MEKNYGINVTGGNFTAGAVAAGDHARATNISATGSLVDARTEMQPTPRVAQRARRRTGAPEETIAVADLARRELDGDEPDKASVLGWLKLIASGAGSIAAISGAVSAVEQAVTALL